MSPFYSPAPGIVFLVGAGPGDPGLITVKGLACIRRAEVLVHDRLVSEELLAEARPDCARIHVGKRAGHHTLRQEEINALLVEHARAGRVVTRLKGGDPFVFGRGGEEAAALAAAGVAFEVVPGVSAAVAVPAYAGIPVTHRGLAAAFQVIAGYEDPSKSDTQVDWARLAPGDDTLIFLMGMQHLASIATHLVAHGRPAATPVALIRWGTYAHQQVLTGTLADIAARAAAAAFAAPVVIVVGEVVRLHESLAWYDGQPARWWRDWLTPVLGEHLVLVEAGRR